MNRYLAALRWVSTLAMERPSATIGTEIHTAGSEDKEINLRNLIRIQLLSMVSAVGIEPTT